MTLCLYVKILHSALECTKQECAFYKPNGCWANYEEIEYDNTPFDPKEVSPLLEMIVRGVFPTNETK